LAFLFGRATTFAGYGVVGLYTVSTKKKRGMPLPSLMYSMNNYLNCYFIFKNYIQVYNDILKRRLINTATKSQT